MYPKLFVVRSLYKVLFRMSNTFVLQLNTFIPVYLRLLKYVGNLKQLMDPFISQNYQDFNH